jgi:hypothetical protein
LEKAMMMHYRPIYVSETDETDGDYLNAFMLFTGRRWGIFMAPDDFDPANKTIEREEFRRFFVENDSTNKPVETMKNIRLVYSSFEPIFFSLPLNYGEEFYHKQAGTPWVGTEEAEASVIFSRYADDSQQLPVRFLCSDCVRCGLCGTSQPCLPSLTSVCLICDPRLLLGCGSGETLAFAKMAAIAMMLVDVYVPTTIRKLWSSCHVLIFELDSHSLCHYLVCCRGYQCERAKLCTEADTSWCNAEGVCDTADGVCIGCDPGKCPLVFQTLCPRSPTKL